MYIFLKSFSALGAALSAAIFFVPVNAFAQENIAVIAGMQTNVMRSGRSLRVGQNIRVGDKLRTDRTGISQFQFRDRSTAKLGPNSRVTFTKEIVNIANRQSSIAVRMLNGVARFTGSDSTKSKPLAVVTPNMSLGVMGGLVNVAVVNGKTQAALISGRMVCKSGNQQKAVNRSGYSCVVGPSGDLKLAKTPRNFSAVLDSTKIPNAGNARHGRVKIDLVDELPLDCGAQTDAASPRCSVSSGGFPLPTENEGSPAVTYTPSTNNSVCPLGFYYHSPIMGCEPV